MIRTPRHVSRFTSRLAQARSLSQVKCPHSRHIEVSHAKANTPYDEAKEGPIPFRPYDGPEKCTWKAGAADSPHESHKQVSGIGRSAGKIVDSMLDLIGGTPMVRMSRFAKLQGIDCELLAKAEFLSAGGSVKDRIGLRMVSEAERSGRIKPGDTLIEATSGNAGIGLALSAAVKGYNMVITMPKKMSGEKVNTMRALGAEILRTPTEAGWKDTDSHIALALRIQKELENSHILDQYQNPSNPMAHYEGTAEEILEQCEGKLDYIFMTTGTGGTLTGVARKLREKIPNVKIIGVDPKGSILAQPAALNDEGLGDGYHVEGIGYDFIPTVLDRPLVDEWVKTEDGESFAAARDCIRSEGLLCGGSSGSALAAMARYCKEHKLGPDTRVVVLLPDSIRNYMYKFLDDGWMQENGFMAPEAPELPSQPADVEPKSGEWIQKPLGFSTTAVHAGVTPDKKTGAILTPIFQSTTFVQESVDKYLEKGFSYSRTNNPTVKAFEERVAQMENGFGATATSTGMAATTLVILTTMQKGDHCVITDCSYGGTNRICREHFSTMGMEFDFVDFRDMDKVRAAIKPNTKLIFSETPSNPTLQIADIENLSKLAQEVGALHVCDSTFGTPYIVRPMDWGADFTMQSLTKYYDGHNLGTGGAIISKNEELHARIQHTRNMHGNIMSPQVASAMAATCKTMPLRVERQSATAMKIATFLESHPAVTKVVYPGLKSFPQKALADKYHRNNCHGGMLWFDVVGGDKAATKLMNTVQRPWSLCENLGATESIITACAVMTHANMLKEDRMKVGISDGFIRISCGIEDSEDLMVALKTSLDRL